MNKNQNKIESTEQLNLVIVGHVDHGKSTVIGRLLADTGSLPDGKLEQVKENCEKNSKPFEYAFLLDALKDEQSQGITIDAARVFFKTSKRQYIIIDAPGHIEFLKNMVTGASRAEAALLVIDAEEGVQENSRRHGYMLSMLGVKQLSVVVNKMDLVDYQEEVYNKIVTEYTKFLHSINVEPKQFVPVSGIHGDAIAQQSNNMNWYKEKTLLEILDDFQKEPDPVDSFFRMPVQDIYKFTKYGDSRRVVAGSIESGAISVGDEIVFYPSGKKSSVKSIERFNAPEVNSIGAGNAVGLTLNEQIYITRGELASKVSELEPQSTCRLKASLFWMGKEPLVTDKEYLLKIGTAKVIVKLEEIIHIIDASDLKQHSKTIVERHDVAECVFSTAKPVSFDCAEDNAKTSRFVIIDSYEIRGGGIILQALEDKQSGLRKKVYLRNYKWEKSNISFEERAEKYNQKSRLILITGGKKVGKKPIAKGLEARLFRDGKVVYFIGMSNILYGIDSDIKNTDFEKSHIEEHIRRMAEVAYIMVEAGLIVIVTAVGLQQSDFDIISTIINPDRINTIWVGETVSTDINFDLHITSRDIDDSIDKIKNYLYDTGIIFKPW